MSEDAREFADEQGELDGNQQYLDVSCASWEDVSYALDIERRTIAEYESSHDPGRVLERFADVQDSEDEREALWHLELGVAATVMALNALGAHTALSCNGGAFGGNHLRDCPSVRFYPQEAAIAELLQLARDSGVGLIEEEGRALLYASKISDLQRFAALALERFGGLRT